MIIDFEKYKLFESLPRENSIKQLQRVMDEIRKESEIKIGPIKVKSKGELGDQVVADLEKHKGWNNLFWWDNPIDRKIDTYEDFVKHDNKMGLGYIG